MNHSFSELKRTARLTLNERYRVPILAFLLTIIISSLLLVPFRYLLNESIAQTILYYLASIVIQLLISVLMAGQLLLHLNLRRKKAYSLSNVFFYINHHPDRFILANLFLLLLMIVCMIPSILLSIPAMIHQDLSSYILMGIGFVLSIIFAILIQLKYALISFLLIDYPTMTVRQAFYTSRMLMKKQTFRLFLLNLSFLGWYILGFGSFLIGFLWIISYRQQTLIGFYSDCLSTMNMNQSKDIETHDTNSTFETYC